MSSLQYYSYPGMGRILREKHGYNSAVRVGDTIEVSGQGGWDNETGEIKKDYIEEMDQAFENVERALKEAGGTGWDQVYRITSYHTVFGDELMHMVDNLKKYIPNHKPILTVIGVRELAIEGMRVEIQVAAYDPEGAERARKTSSSADGVKNTE